ncbi:MAG: ATPase, T2SS/T4P/T4SS family [Aquiluna sp.]|nr:ATPase, T2SS/T4P/T4SS family [Aquiluna sp.]
MIATANDIWQIIETPGVTDLVVDGFDSARADFGEGFQNLPALYSSDQEMSQEIVSLALEAGSRIDIAKPVADFVYRGARFHAVLPFGLSTKPLLSIRIHPEDPHTLDSLQHSRMVSLAQVDWLRRQILNGKNIVFSGPTGVGKTTLLRAALRGSGERIICIEQTSELLLDAPAIALTEREANQEGVGQIELDELIIHALRMRPDRIVVGEVRSKEFRVLLQAINNGHRGTLTTLHANNLESVADRFLVLGILGGFNTELTSRLVSQSIDYVVQLNRIGNQRAVSGIGIPKLVEGVLRVDEVVI